MKTLIVTGANEPFKPLLYGLLNSLRQWPEPLADGIAVLDVGLSESTRRELAAEVDHLVCPDWDLPYAPALRASRGHERAKLARPFLPRYFPGYELYLWIDADCWVQERYAVEWFFEAAADGALAIAPSQDRSYHYTAASLDWRQRYLSAYYGEEGLQFYREALGLYHNRVYYNDGVFCLRAEAPHWASWARHFGAGLARHPDGVSDQAAMNYAIWKDDLPVHPLPSLCNWACHFAIPRIEERTGKHCEPHVPYRPIGIVHMTGDTKDYSWRVERAGVSERRDLRYPGGCESLRPRASGNVTPMAPARMPARAR